METKQLFIVDGVEFEDELEATLYQDILEAGKAYRESAKHYEEVLNSCSCNSLIFVEKVMRDCGKPYSDEFDNWHNDRIPVENYRCKCCGKDWSYADYEGKGRSWRHSGKILVQIGRF